MKKIAVIVGARPNYMKITQFKRLCKEYEYDFMLIHTGQHYDKQMTDVFFEQFDLHPDKMIIPKKFTPTGQIGTIILELEPILIDYQPDIVFVVGDVNSSLAGAIAAHKSGFKLAHIEAGLRCGDRSMPEEINRILIDELSDFLFTTEKEATGELMKAGITQNIYYVGDPMIETLVNYKEQIEDCRIKEEMGIFEDYCLATIHRQSNVDDKETLAEIIDILRVIAHDVIVVFPAHHRFMKQAQKHNLLSNLNVISNLRLIDPLDYISFQSLLSQSLFIITDSGGLQAEAAYWGVKCILLRDRTEKEYYVVKGTTYLCGVDWLTIYFAIKDKDKKNIMIPEYFNTTERIFEIISKQI